jgi:transcriptional regulator GlxA family with amidase domain
LHECADTTPADFINHYRIRHAAMLLTTTDQPVGLIAEQCGIASRPTFNRLFREHYSMTPTEYRNAANLRFKGVPEGRGIKRRG